MTDLMELVSRVEAGDIAAAATLFQEAIQHMQDGWDWEGWELQATCLKAGLTYERPYNPETDHGMDAEVGDSVWVPTDAGKRLLVLARAHQGAAHVDQ